MNREASKLKGSAQNAPFFIRSLLLPVTLVSVLSIAHYFMTQGYDIPAVLGAMTFVGFFVVALCERIWPYHSEWNSNAQRDLQVDILHFIHNGFWVRTIETVVRVGCVVVAIHLAGFFGSTVWPTQWHWSAQVVLGLVLGESVEYWIHRLQHEVPWFWRFHAVHHSAPRLYWLNAVRFHPIDVVVSTVGRLAPVAMLGGDPQILGLLTLFSGVHAVFMHCNIPMRAGPFNWILASGELHRWHHSTRLEESNTNYGGDLILWDIICGTRFLPKDREPPVVIGLANMTHYPMSFWEQIKSPFRWQKILQDNP
jgi:sterol desaturase/sphingolipid hydroxylase (fatty acid hydroxylase superfamily)